MTAGTTYAAYSDYEDASEVNRHADSTDDERTATAHVMAAYDLRAICERSDLAIVNAAGVRLGLW